VISVEGPGGVPNRQALLVDPAPLSEPMTNPSQALVAVSVRPRADLALQARGGASRVIEGEAAAGPLLPETRRFRRGVRRGRRTMPTSG
jgi:hypothetical protein